MDLHQLLIEYVNDGRKLERKPGHIGASELYGIIKGYTTTKNYKRGGIELLGCQRIIGGVAMEDMLHKIFDTMKIDVLCQTSYEIPLGEGFFIDVHPDFEFPDRVLETKFPLGKTDEYLLNTYQYQCEAQHRATGKPVFIGKFVIPFDVHFIEFKPSAERWELIKKSALEFCKAIQNLDCKT